MFELGWKRSGARPVRSPSTRTQARLEPPEQTVRARACLFALLLAHGCLAPPGPTSRSTIWSARSIEDTNYKVRVQAALVLGKLGDPRAVQPLIKALADQNKTVRGIAASALGQLGDSAAVDPLRGLLRRESDPFVRGQAEKAMAALAAAAGAGASARRSTSTSARSWAA